MSIFQSTGTLRYSPKLLGSSSEKWWLVVDCDREIGRYYRTLFQDIFFKARKLQRPAWKEHISVIRNEEPPDDKKFLWEKYDGNKVDFYYDPNVQFIGVYYWLNVQCPFLLDIREELGLPRKPEYDLHLTIGNIP